MCENASSQIFTTETHFSAYINYNMKNIREIWAFSLFQSSEIICFFCALYLLCISLTHIIFLPAQIIWFPSYIISYSCDIDIITFCGAINVGAQQRINALANKFGSRSPWTTHSIRFSNLIAPVFLSDFKIISSFEVAD